MNPNEIAAGDNPAKLTNAQVGAGYRLIETYPNASNEDFGFRLDQREVTIPEVLTQRHGWRAVRWDEVDWAWIEAIPGMPVKLDGTNILVALPFSFRVPLTPEFIAWKARQRPERVTAARYKEQRVRQARECIDIWTRELARAASDYDAARRRAFEATAAEYGYVPPPDSIAMSVGDMRVLGNPIEIRFAGGSFDGTPQFPPLPADAKWANPENITPEQFEVDKGWRPLCSLDTEWPDDNEYYSNAIGEWVWGGPGLTNPRNQVFRSGSLTYRTKAPIPTGN